ncbi:MAG: SCP2 sterol-binding domain-containing protein [Pseudomonadota bacterium]
MSDVIAKAVEALAAKMPSGFDGVVKFIIEDEGSVIVDSDGVRASDDEAEVTLTADVDTFQGVLSGDVNPTSAFMGGQLKVDGDMGAAMRLASILV